MYYDSVLQSFHLIILLSFQHYALWFSFTVFTSYNREAILTLCTVIQFTVFPSYNLAAISTWCTVIQFYNLDILQSCCHFNIKHCDSSLQSLHLTILLSFQHYALWFKFTVFTLYNLAAISTLCTVIQFYSLYINQHTLANFPFS